MIKKFQMQTYQRINKDRAIIKLRRAIDDIDDFFNNIESLKVKNANHNNTDNIIVLLISTNNLKKFSCSYSSIQPTSSNS